MPEIVSLPGGTRWRIGETEFRYNYTNESFAKRFSIRKPPELVDQYIELCKGNRHVNIVELGIAAGGSTALLALLAEPKKLVACELADLPVAALAEFLRAHDLEGVVRPFYGVDQSDRPRLIAILDAEFGDEAINLVIDDASHLHDQTRASFEVLFPRLAPGAHYIIEDWGADFIHAKLLLKAMGDTASPEFEQRKQELEATLERQAAGEVFRPLPRLGIELLQVCAMANDVISEVTVNKHWIVARRGDADLDLSSFCLSDHYTDYFGWTTD
jgi:cephalosporin hydroxylase